jgi:hypothetical protein
VKLKMDVTSIEWWFWTVTLAHHRRSSRVDGGLLSGHAGERFAGGLLRNSDPERIVLSLSGADRLFRLYAARLVGRRAGVLLRGPDPGHGHGCPLRPLRHCVGVKGDALEQGDGESAMQAAGGVRANAKRKDLTL